jgi:triosephosphate isomerase
MALKAVKGTKIAVGAQNLYYEPSGAYTGEVSADMLTSLGVKYVIIGHSERREYFNETDFSVNLKLKAALAAGLRPIVCVGEKLVHRDFGVTIDLIRMQVKIALKDIAPADIKKTIIAYEPIWAIGTGRTATAEQANEVNHAIRDCIRDLYGARIARSVTIQYGGSMNDKNAAELLAQPDVDGGLIGGAALKAESFAAIIDAANQ